MLAPMRYKTFVWPHNPRTYTITYARDTAVHKVPMGVYTMQDLGPELPGALRRGGVLRPGCL